MMLGLLIFGTLTLFLITNGLAQEIGPKTYSFKGHNDLKLESNDKKLKFCGRIMSDHFYFYQDEDLDSFTAGSRSSCF